MAHIQHIILQAEATHVLGMVHTETTFLGRSLILPAPELSRGAFTVGCAGAAARAHLSASSQCLLCSAEYRLLSDVNYVSRLPHCANQYIKQT